MSLNRVIGRDNAIPWRLPEDFRWFRRKTTGKVVVMGRKTYESLPGRLPNRRVIVLTRRPRRLIQESPEVFGQFREWRGGRHALLPFQFKFTRLGVQGDRDLLLCGSLGRIDPNLFPCEVFVCGGSEVYRQALPMCSDLFLTVVKREVGDGDSFFPPFETEFVEVAQLAETPEFVIRHYRNRRLMDGEPE